MALVALRAQNKSYCTTDSLFYPWQWGLYNDGQQVLPYNKFGLSTNPFTAGFDISACDAWQYTEGEEIKIGIVYCFGLMFKPYNPQPSDTCVPLDIKENLQEITFVGNTFNNDGTLAFEQVLQYGIIAASRNNSEYVGVAPKCKIYPIYIKDTWAIPQGIDVALNKGMDIIYLPFQDQNMPSSFIDSVASKIQKAQTVGRNGKGCVIISPAGDYNPSEPNSSLSYNYVRFPASIPQVISVGGINPGGTRVQIVKTFHQMYKYDPHFGIYLPLFMDNYHRHSCYGNGLCVVAPGEYIYSTLSCGKNPNDYLDSWSRKYGTQFAAAYVVGVAALGLSVNPSLTAEQLRTIILSSCKQSIYSINFYFFDDNIPIEERGGIDSDPIEKGWNDQIGYGLVDAHATVLAALEMSCYNGLPIVNGKITQNTTWSTSVFASSIITVPNGFTLTITNTVLLGPGAKIIVEPGGKLIVDGGTLTNACEDEMWQGIFVGGNANLPQKPESNQGVLELKNGAIIENARTAIATYTLDAIGNINYATAGGIVKADNATFLNNLKTVDFIPYPPAGTNPVLPNVSYFINKCHFTVDNANLFALNNNNFSCHI